MNCNFVILRSTDSLIHFSIFLLHDDPNAILFLELGHGLSRWRLIELWGLLDVCNLCFDCIYFKRKDAFLSHLISNHCFDIVILLLLVWIEFRPLDYLERSFRLLVIHLAQLEKTPSVEGLFSLHGFLR